MKQVKSLLVAYLYNLKRTPSSTDPLTRSSHVRVRVQEVSTKGRAVVKLCPPCGDRCLNTLLLRRMTTSGQLVGEPTAVNRPAATRSNGRWTRTPHTPRHGYLPGRWDP